MPRVGPDRPVLRAAGRGPPTRRASNVTAGEAWRRAALCWHWGKFVFVDDPDQQRAAHDRTVACFRRGAATLSPPAEPVRVPYQGTALAAYLRVPSQRQPGHPS